MTSSNAESVDQYIAGFDPPVQEVLQQVRKTIQKAAPLAWETISYAIPTFVLNGNLVHYAAFKSHIGFYPGPSGINAFKEELSGYKAAKGSVQFPYTRPIPYDLIAKITELRVDENQRKVKTAR